LPEERPRVRLEVCTENVAGVRAAEAAGAHRIELCSALAEGGVTPSLGLFQQARAHSRLPLHVLVRPRVGDFCYTDLELAVMLDDLALFKEAGADGFVFGALSQDGALNLTQLETLMAAAEGLPVTFHRAFDVCREPLEALEQLVALGVTRLLTSGQQADALAGAPLLRQLNERAAGRLVVMAGGAVRPHNAAQIVRDSGVTELHVSARQPQSAPSSFDLGTPAFTDEACISAILRSL
jgi:copper homeostasis protein